MTRDTRDSGPDGLHDLHLHEALRHAPDADIAAPTPLSAAILQRATAAVRASAPPSSQERPPAPALAPWWSSPWHAVRAAWDQLARPPVAAAFATVLVASTLALLWRDGLMDQDLERPAPAPAHVAAPPEAAIPPTPALAPETAAPAAAPSAKAGQGPSPVAPAAPPSPNRPAPLVQPTPLAQRGDPDAARKAFAQARQESRTPAPPAESKPAARADATPPAPSQQNPAAEPPATAPGVASPAPVATADAAAPSPVIARASNGLKASREPALAPQGLARAAAASPRERPEAVADSRLRSLRGELQTQRARWSTQREGTAPRALDDATPAWLQALAQEATAADAQWALAPPPGAATVAGATAGPADRAGLLLLLRDGIPEHRFQLGAGGVTWDQGDPTVGADRWVLSLPPSAMGRLLAALPALSASRPAPAAPR